MLLGDDLDATVHLVLDIDLTELLLNLGKVFGERLDSLGVHTDDDLIVGVGFALEGHDGLFAIGGVDVNDGDIGDNADDLRGEVLRGEMAHAEILVTIWCALHREFEDGVEGVVEGGLTESLFHDEIEVVGCARGIGLEGTFETIAAAAEGEEQEGGEEDEEVFHIVGIFWAAIDGCDGNAGRTEGERRERGGIRDGDAGRRRSGRRRRCGAPGRGDGRRSRRTCRVRG